MRSTSSLFLTAFLEGSVLFFLSFGRDLVVPAYLLHAYPSEHKKQISFCPRGFALSSFIVRYCEPTFSFPWLRSSGVESFFSACFFAFFCL